MTLRHQWRAHLAVALLLGILGGVSLFAMAGARRTQSSYSRFVRASDVSTMSVDAGANRQLLAAVARFPEVVHAATYVSFDSVELVDGHPEDPKKFEAIGSVDGRYFGQDRFAPTSGRIPDPTRADEVAVNEYAAKRDGYRLGQRLDLGVFTDGQIYRPDFRATAPPPKLRSTVTIVGIGLFPEDVVQDDTERGEMILFSPAYTASAAPFATYAWQGLVLRNGDADIHAVKQRYLELLPPGSPQYFRVTSVNTFHSLQAVRPLSIALSAFGLIAAVAAITLVGQALGRTVRLDREERMTLRALGASPGAIVRSGMVAPVLAILAGAVFAVLLAVMASPAMPIGRVRKVEVARGIDVDLAALGLGALAFTLALLGITLFVLWRELPHRIVDRPAGRPSTIVSFAAGHGMSPPAVVGLRLALEPGDAGASPTRSVMAGATIAVAALVASLTFGSSLAALVDSPRLFGWSWNATLLDTQGYGNTRDDQAHAVLDHDDAVDTWSGAFFGSDLIDGRNVPLLGMAADSHVFPPLVKGRPIANADETVLGAETATQLDKHVGDTVSVGVGDHPYAMRVVGIATFPTIGIIHGAHTSLGVGALVVPQRVPGFDLNITGTHTHGPNAIFIRFRPGVDTAATIARLQDPVQGIGGSPGAATLLPALQPAEIVNSNDIGNAPSLLAGTLATGALISLGLALFASIRQRRRDLALLKVLGFTPRQIAATVAWQSTATVATGLTFGIPIGVALGSKLWSLFARQLDVGLATTIPVLRLLALTAAALAFANIAAAMPAGFARRVRAASVLRAS